MGYSRAPNPAATFALAAARLLFLSAVVLASFSSRSWAVFTKSQLEQIDSEPLFDSEYFLDLLSFRFPMEWDELWRSTGSGYRINGASLDCCDLFLQQELRFQHRLTDGLTFRYSLAQQDDKDLQDFHQWLELEQDLGLGFSGLMFGEPTFRKEDSDIGFGLGFHRNKFRAAVRHYFVDFNFNERGHTTERFAVKPGTDRLSLAYADGGQELSADLEIDYPLRLDIPDENRQFSYRRTTAGAHWRQSLRDGWSRKVEYVYQFQDKGNLFRPDPGAQSLDTRRQVHQALLAFEGPISRRDRLELGHSFLARAARTENSSAPQSEIFYRRWEAQPYARWRRLIAPWFETELASFLSFGENRKRSPGEPAASRYSDIIQAKIGTGADFIFGSKGRIGLYGTWDADSPSDPWDGGNVRAMFFF